MNKKDLKNLDIITLRNGDRLMLRFTNVNGCNYFTDLDETNNNWIVELNDLTDDLKQKSSNCPENDIVKVERSFNYEKIYERQEDEEMTLKEVCNELGRTIKIIK